MAWRILKIVPLLTLTVACGGPVESNVEVISGAGAEAGSMAGAGGAARSGGSRGSAGSIGSGVKLDAGVGESDAAVVSDSAVPMDASFVTAKLDAAPSLDAPSAVAVELKLAATEDTFVQGSGPGDNLVLVDNSNTNFGDKPTLLVKYRPLPTDQYYWRESYVKFSIESAKTVQKALLVLTVRMSTVTNGIGPVSTLEARESTSNWGELAATWANKVGAKGVIGAQAIPSAQPATMTFDVTAYVKKCKLLSASSVSFALTQQMAGATDIPDRFEIDSREAGATGPILIVTSSN